MSVLGEQNGQLLEWVRVCEGNIRDSRRTVGEDSNGFDTVIVVTVELGH